MPKNRPLTLPFINRLDRYLLLHHPETWSSRIHLVAWYCTLFALALAAVCFIAPNDPRLYSNSASWVSLVIIIAAVAAILWIIYLLRFNVFKRFGKTDAKQRLLNFLFIFTSFALFSALPFIQPLAETARANAAYSTSELVGDADAINEAVVRLEYNTIDHRWGSELLIAVDSVRFTEVDHRTDIVNSNGTRPPTYIEKEDLDEHLSGADSVVQLTDSSYMIYSCPLYSFLSLDTDSEFTNKRSKNSVELYRSIVRDYKPLPLEPYRLKIAELQKKYIVNNYDYDYYEPQTDYERIRRRYKLNSIGSSMLNITDRKYRWSHDVLSFTLRMAFYTSLILALLLFSFRHSTARTFFLSLLSAVVLSVLTALLLAFSRSDENTFFAFTFFYFLSFVLMSVKIFSSRRRSLMNGIALNLAFWMLPFMPLLCVAWYYAGRNWYYGLEDDERLHLHYAEFAGPMLLLIAIFFFFHGAYRKWYAAPVD